MTVATAILCAFQPRHVVELVRALHHRGHPILLHADAKAPPAMQAALAGLAAALPDVHVVAPVLCSWGGWSLVEATLRALAQALALPTPWRHFALLSEHHIPLQPPDVIAKSLPGGVSFSDAVPLPAMDRDHRADLLHRFAREWRELPGVGMFATLPRTLGQAEMGGLRLGSQWVVLARAACERLVSVRGDATLWAPFRSSLVPDETALMSVLRGTPLGHGLDVRVANPTFVAWPHLGGGRDSGFTDETVRAARARGHLFIRKRPDRLPPYAAALLGAMPARPPVVLPPPLDLPQHDGRASELADGLTRALAARHPGLAVTSPPPGTGPACCLELRAAGMAASLSVHLLSQDFTAFKILLAWRRPFDGMLAPIRLGGLEATIMGARLPGLVLAREIHLGLPDHGFVQTYPDRLGDLAAPLATALAAAMRLAPQG